jgi:hypothetical protein
MKSIMKNAVDKVSLRRLPALRTRYSKKFFARYSAIVLNEFARGDIRQL